jgi:hypothetical protein
MAFYIKHSIGISDFIHLFIFCVNSKTVVIIVAVGFYGRQSVVFIIAFSLLIPKPTIRLDPESDTFLNLTTCGCHQIPLLDPILSGLNPICTYFSKINATLKLVMITYFHVLAITHCLVSLDMPHTDAAVDSKQPGC